MPCGVCKTAGKGKGVGSGGARQALPLTFKQSSCSQTWKGGKEKQ